MNRLIFPLAAVLFLASASFAQPKDSRRGCQGLNGKVIALIGEYKELRERSRQLPDGVYDKDLRDHDGKLHRVLSSLSIELGHPPYTKQLIVECVGAPDAIKNGKQMARFLEIYNQELRKAGRKVEKKRNREYLIYYWRGGHDFMFFISEGGLIVDHGWWFAYE
jgi:hypothetical protein